MTEPIRSTATNAYDLLADVATAIREVPARYNQSWWGVLTGTRVWDSLSQRPECGTVACRAGWITQLADGNLPVPTDSAYQAQQVGVDEGKIMDRAREVLGLSVDYRNQLDAEYYEWRDARYGPDSREQTPEVFPRKHDRDYARAVENLFEGSALRDEYDARDTDYDNAFGEPSPGTPEYAELGAKGIDEFLATWADRLKNTPITAPPVEVPHVD